MYPNPPTTLPPREHFARGAICVAYKRYLGTYRMGDTPEAIEQFAEVMTDGGTETFVGKSRDGIVAILGERAQANQLLTPAHLLPHRANR